MKKNNESEESGFNKVAKKVNDPGEVIIIINQYDEIIKSHNERVIGYEAKEGQLLKKSREVEDFIQNVRQNKLIIFYKIEMHKFLKKYPSLKNSTLPQSCLRNNFKTIKVVCKEKVEMYFFR